MHTRWSDGADTLEAMIAAAAARGYEYHCDLRSLARARGMRARPGRAARAARRRARALGERYGIRTLCSAEVDILADGSLDYDDALLAELDIVVASVHAGHEPVARRDDARG